MLNIDRYHATMGDASYKEVTRLHDGLLSDTEATFYVTQRKLPYAPCLGHERLLRSLLDLRIDRPRLRTLEQQLNASDLPDDVKVRLQGYITGCYGSLTSFNVLFADEDDHFKGTGGE